MKTILLTVLLTAMSCVAQTNYIGLEPRPQMTYATNHYVLAESVLGTNRFTHESTIQGIGCQNIFHVKDFTDNNTITILSTNAIIKCTPGLSSIISKDTNGIWTVEFRKEQDMTIKIGLWILPTAFTVLFLVMMLRPYQRSGDYDFGMIFRSLWLIPAAAVWAIYFGLMLALK